MRISVSPTIYTHLKAEHEALKRGFVLGADAAFRSLVDLQQPEPTEQEKPDGGDATDTPKN
jgi:hypothetical protein